MCALPRTARVNSAPGTLPAASLATMSQRTWRRRECTTTPPALVTAAYSRSVPTAVAGLTPNSSTSNGVINEPPPTPVMPTMAPTTKPESVNARSITIGLGSTDHPRCNGVVRRLVDQDEAAGRVIVRVEIGEYRLRERELHAADVVAYERGRRGFPSLRRHVPQVIDAIDARADLARGMAQQISALRIERYVAEPAQRRVEGAGDWR